MTRDEELRSLAPTVSYHASTLKRRLPRSVSVEDLESEGWIGALGALDQFDPARGFKLSTFAQHRIRYAMCDSLRELDPLSRWHRHKVNRGVAHDVLTVSLGESPRRDEMAGPIAAKACPRAERDQRALDARLDIEKLFARANLKPRWREALLRYFVQGETLREVGRALGVGESRASQICGAAMRKLRAATESASAPALASAMRPEARR